MSVVRAGPAADDRALADGAVDPPYHRLARTPATRWWRVLLGVPVLGIAGIVALVVCVGLAYAVHTPRLDARAGRLDLVWEFAAICVGLGALVGVSLLTARWVDGRPAGFLSSVTGGLRWRWLGTCLLIAAVPFGVLGVVSALIAPPEGGWDAVDWRLVGAMALVTVALVPLQAAGEEYVFRGYLAQAAGVYVRSPWPPAVLISLLFAAAHGDDGGTWAFVDRAAFGLVVAWLTIRTGGLEAAIAVHAAGNVVALLLLTVDGELRGFLVGAGPEGTAITTAAGVGVLAAIAAVLVRRARPRLSPRVRERPRTPRE